MTTNYDPIAEQYKRSKQQPWRTFVECFTLVNLIGDLRGKDVLDVACGEGFYTRMIRERGAARVTGVDLSHGMIELARQQEAQHQLGIKYVVGDARELPEDDQVDLAVAAYLLNYAGNRKEIQEMCDGIARSLKPGGRFITVNCNPALAFPHAPSYRKYGFETNVPGEWQEGAPIKWTFYLSDGAFEIENYHFKCGSSRRGIPPGRVSRGSLACPAVVTRWAGGSRRRLLVESAGSSPGGIHRVLEVTGLRLLLPQLPNHFIQPSPPFLLK